MQDDTKYIQNVLLQTEILKHTGCWCWKLIWTGLGQIFIEKAFIDRQKNSIKFSLMKETDF